ncbi:Hypothetical protein R9X50_00212900 [Acrodontium crateriforme]|uniref:DUF7918 domain-containing protein n=1 Tax=Acrodontium crateriforme TaxID=150365 RepID=A0AAQ3M1P9_9PEZI|nr:Hypothetical protein R9X50_00212900 [Acrodontium crateriforme]
MRVDSIPGLAVTIRMNDGDDLPEIPDVENEPQANRAACYIEAVAGANFSIHVVPRSDFHAPEPSLDYLSCYVKLDGKRMSIQNSVGAPYASVIRGIEDDTNGVRAVRKFQFGALSTTDDVNDASERQADDLKGLGQIEIVCIWTRPGRESSTVSSHYAPVGPIIHEKALKGRAISNRVIFGQPEIQGGQPLRSCFPLFPYGYVPIAGFRFKYRSRKDLHDEHIIPRSPTLVPLEDRDPETLTLEEGRELARLLRAQRDQAPEAHRNEERPVRREKRTNVVIDLDAVDDETPLIVNSESSQNKRPRTALKNQST